MRLRVGEHEIWYRKRGPGNSPPVVTVHGFVISQRYMAPLARRLARTRRVLSPDLPGFGRSSKPHDALTIDGLADALAAFLVEVDASPADIVGNSMGCQVAMALAERHPSRARRLVRIGPTTDAHARTLPRQTIRLARDIVRERPSLPWIHVPDYFRCGPRRIAQTARHLMHDAIEARAPHVAAPTLLVRGSRDALVSQQFVEELAVAMPNARVEVLPGAPHAANYSAPAITAELIEGFLSEAPALPGRALLPRGAHA